MNYDQAVEQIRLQNAPILNEFEDWLTASGVSPKTIKSHIDNIEFFAQYLVYYEPLKKLDQATEDDVYTFLSDWFPRKAMWASASSTKLNMASFRKFFKFLHESHRIDKEIQADVLSTLKEFKDEFLDAVAFDEDEKW